MARATTRTTYLVAENMPKDTAPALALAALGWSGVRRLARHSMKDLNLQIDWYLDELQADDFVSAYADAMTRHPELDPSAARELVMPYWLLSGFAHHRFPEQKQIERMRQWLQPHFLKKRDQLSRSDFVTLAYLGAAPKL
jgi:hypothetical protein